MLSLNEKANSITVGLNRNVAGIDVGSKIPNPFNIIAGHEVLGHGLGYLLKDPGWASDLNNSPTNQVENLLRNEQHLPEFHPTWLGPDYY